MTFSEALKLVKNGHQIRLKKWEEDVAIACQFPDENSQNTHPYLYAIGQFGRVPWTPTVFELFSNDWEEMI